ncbi:ABC transporter ATP-binding protein [Halostagnicola kamekurae]|uniref:ABC-2 type transport system ATP-binding protein n=1 Tax=Halostagnicola kamekurae TaxID=619731 RepID=A0A1I6SPL0_9EURY|nr:ABC transporter ATP-binding protein [Halostagnicola kamekurae]SFS78874.1 ABC-2 type transport system ATP-binding protein [Halostagnicola kamekurae]
MTGTPTIVTNELTKEYLETTAVDGLSLEIEPGTVYGFLGPNGAGKTTTIKMLTALIRPTSGSGRVAEVPITDRERLVEHIGYLPESPPIHEELTAREQLEYHGGLRGLGSTEIDERIEPLLERLDLAADADDRIVTYSKGMRQKTGLIQAIMHEPEVVFLDEPTSGLDPRAARTVREVITELADSGTTVFLSTHILPVVERIATEVGILYEGELVEEGAPEALVERMETGDDSTLEDVFLDVTTTAE